MKLELAEHVAASFVDRIRPHCGRVAIAGSIRRRRPEVKDVEVVAEPKPSLYPLILEMKNNLEVVMTRKRSDGGMPPFGPKYYALSFLYMEEGLPKAYYSVDLFCVTPPGDWWPIFLLRTGSADFNIWFVTKIKQFDYRFNGGHVEVLSGSKTLADRKVDLWKPVKIGSEEELFKLCGLKFIPPEERDLPADWLGGAWWERWSLGGGAKKGGEG